MNKRRPPATEEELVHAFADLFDEVGPETPEEIDAVLREGGHDPDTIAARMKSIAERALARSPLNWRNRAQQELEAERTKLDRVTPVARHDRSEIIAAIQQLLSRLQAHQLAPAHAYRNFDQATDEDLSSLLAELEYLVAGKPVNEDEK
jgi:hypothetical protein